MNGLHYWKMLCINRVQTNFDLFRTDFQIVQSQILISGINRFNIKRKCDKENTIKQFFTRSKIVHSKVATPWIWVIILIRKENII